ncbi:MAG: exo-1,3-beta-glucanase [Sclerophora amabilis]|nr:MAG: exo-1,3-beta-glucanase [Sclerophora amabilis]
MMFARKAIAALFLLSACVEPSPLRQVKPRDLSFGYSNEKVRGVNLGGWFVLEPWITPSIFEEWENGGGVVDEYTYSKKLGQDEAYRRLSKHWNSWITEDDFGQIAQAGLNHVRIPIGYWAVAPLDGDPYVQGQLDILDQAIGWARGAGLKVMIDLHGAPGSQNGFDNSGKYGDVGWQQGDTVSETIDAVRGLAERYASDTEVVTAIQLLNEPLGPVLDLDSIKGFYYDGWGTVRDSNEDVAVAIHDAFQDVKDWNGFMNSDSGTNNVILDTHQYQIFSPDQVARSPDEHVSSACNLGSEQLGSSDKWTIVGEWTAGQTDCAKWLNGLGKGARYDGSYEDSEYVGDCFGKNQGSVSNMPKADKDNLRHYVEAQLDAYEQGSGWIFWTWKTESAPEWHMKELLEEGLFPQPLTSRKYRNQCGY